jgi:prophage tail gpP-like protein
MAARHQVVIEVEGEQLAEVLDYAIENDMLSPADDFSLSVGPVTKKLRNAVAPDRQVRVLLDGTAVLTGFIDQRQRRKSRSEGSLLRVTGRDKGGRLVDESMPLMTFKGQSLESLAKEVAGPWFSEIRFSNAKNRALIRGPRPILASAWDEPETPAEVADKKQLLEKYGSRVRKDSNGNLVVYGKSDAPGGILEAGKAPRKVEPGETRWEVLRHFLEPARFLCWSTADGKALVLGVPNYQQTPQFQFFLPADQNSSRRQYSNVIDWDWVDSVADRYSEIEVMGAARGKKQSYGTELRSRTSAFDGPGPSGTGRDFKRRKKLIVADDDIKNPSDAKARANREMAQRDQTRTVLKVTVDGHGQRYNSSSREAIYAFDTIADVFDEELDEGARMYITAVEFAGSKGSGETTTLTMVPVGTELSL